MEENDVIAGKLKEFDEKVAEHAHLTDELLKKEKNTESRTVEFGLKVLVGDRIFSVVDFENIRKWLSSALHDSYAKGKKDERERCVAAVKKLEKVGEPLFI